MGWMLLPPLGVVVVAVGCAAAGSWFVSIAKLARVAKRRAEMEKKRTN